ncbi:MAG: hypothetical protein KDA72_16605, partial [Planctomycetales bacterium]|nr:hypothetical protein [Planctomycetales bacterium]
TYGKGSVQGLFHTKSLASGIRLTVSKFYSPSGKAIAEKGVPPNVAVADEPESNLHFVAKQAQGGAAQGGAELQDKALQVAIEQARRSLMTAQTVAAHK